MNYNFPVFYHVISILRGSAFLDGGIHTFNKDTMKRSTLCRSVMNMSHDITLKTEQESAVTLHFMKR
jgi:hypothetical protein